MTLLCKTWLFSLCFRSATQIPFGPAGPAQSMSKEDIQIASTITPDNTDLLLKPSSESQGKYLP